MEVEVPWVSKGNQIQKIFLKNPEKPSNQSHSPIALLQRFAGDAYSIQWPAMSALFSAASHNRLCKRELILECDNLHNY